MFDKQYRFRGKHAMQVSDLTAQFDAESKAQLFRRNLDVLINAPLIGFLFGRKAEKDDAKNPNTGKVAEESVFDEQVINNKETLEFNFKLIILLDTEYEAKEEARVNRAFRHPGEDPADMELFDAYTRGGVEVLHEKLIEGVSDPSEYISRLYEFVEEFDERFNDGITSDVLLSLCAGK